VALLAPAPARAARAPRRAFTAPRFAALIAGAELVALPGAGHVPMVDAPRVVARTILDFTTAQSSNGS